MYLENYKEKLYSESRKLINYHTGNIISVTFRPFSPGDEEGIIRCIKEEYNDSYFKTSFYDRDYLLKNAISDRYVFFVAVVEEEIVAMEIFTLFGKDEPYIEPATQIILKDYRGYNMADEFVDYTYKIARNMNPSCLFVHAVTHHAITQHVVAKHGMIPVGFRFGRFLTDKMHNNYKLGRCEKYSEGILIEPVGKRDAGTLYIPDELCDFVSELYDSLGVKYNIVRTKPGSTNLALESSENDFIYVRDEFQRFCEIRINSFKKDTKDKLKALINEDDKPHWTYQIIANISDAGFAECYESLKALGFFFSGIRPLCSENEEIYMHYLGKTKLYIDDYKLTEEFRELANKIKDFMKEENQ